MMIKIVLFAFYNIIGNYNAGYVENKFVRNVTKLY
jgi:hypothetical protein